MDDSSLYLAVLSWPNLWTRELATAG